MDAVPSRCWLHPDVVVEVSSIEGRGLFASARLRAGEVVARLGGPVVDEAELRRMLNERAVDPSVPYIDTISLDGNNRHLILPPGNLVRFGNHSCDPNLWWLDSLTLGARRDIEAGEEVTTDYATSTGVSGFRMTCSCGSANCRRVVTGDDWKLEALRAAYGAHWTAALLARF
jgi:SET domain-containing protein